MIPRHANKNTPSQKRRNAEAKGRRAEWVAILFLTLKNYRICERRWKSRLGEIDIIARKGRKIIFIEVKQRQRLDTARRAVTPAATRRLTQAAEFYVQHRLTKLPENFEVRFDIIAIAPFGLHHERDAFAPY